MGDERSMFNRSKLWAVGFLVAAFASGVAVGGVANAAFGDRDRHTPPPDRRRDETSYLDRLDRELRLAPVQRDSVAAVLARYDDPMRELWRDSRQRFDSLRGEVRKDITALLDSQQRERFQQMNQHVDSVRAGRERGGPNRDF